MPFGFSLISLVWFDKTRNDNCYISTYLCRALGDLWIKKALCKYFCNDVLLPFCLPVQERTRAKKQVRTINKYAAYDGLSPQINTIVTMNAEEERGQHMAEMKV